MTPQERDLILSLLGRLQQSANQPKDREAEDLIRQGIATQPDAPYLLVQTVLIQDMGLSDAHHRIKDLEQQLEAARRAPQPQPQPQPQPSSFLAGARGSVPASGPWGAPPAPGGPVWTQSAAAPAPSSPWASLATPSASSGFLRQAASTAAGVAGGALLFEGIRSMFGPHYGGGFLSGMSTQPGLGETVINNYYDAPASGAPDVNQADVNGNNDWNNDPGMTSADFGPDPSGQDDGSNQDFSDQPDFDSGQDMGDGSIDV